MKELKDLEQEFHLVLSSLQDYLTSLKDGGGVEEIPQQQVLPSKGKGDLLKQVRKNLGERT